MAAGSTLTRFPLAAVKGGEVVESRPVSSQDGGQGAAKGTLVQFVVHDDTGEIPVAFAKFSLT